MAEIVPRFALHLQFLKAHPKIIHIPVPQVGGQTAELMKIIRLDKSITSSHWSPSSLDGLSAKATGCGNANIQKRQMSQRYRNELNKLFLFS